MLTRARAMENAPTSKLRSHSKRFTTVTKARQQQQQQHSTSSNISTSFYSSSSTSTAPKKRSTASVKTRSGMSHSTKKKQRKSTAVASTSSSTTKKGSPTTVSNNGGSEKQRVKLAKVHSRDDEDEESNTKMKKKQKIEKEVVERVKLQKSDPEYVRIEAEVAGSSCFAICIVSIERVRNDRLERRFDEAKLELMKKGHDGIQTTYHGTPTSNISSIVSRGLLMAKVGTNRGSASGAGLYLTQNIRQATIFSPTNMRGIHTILQFDCLPGRSYTIPLPLRQSYQGAACKSGYDSHRVDSVFILFQESHALLRYIIELQY